MPEHEPEQVESVLDESDSIKLPDTSLSTRFILLCRRYYKVGMSPRFFLYQVGRLLTLALVGFRAPNVKVAAVCQEKAAIISIDTS